MESNILIHFKNCHLNSLCNLKLNKKYKMRSGQVFYMGKFKEGEVDIGISVRKFYPPAGHSWIETGDGYIIDWVINHNLKDYTKKKWPIDDLEDLGFYYRYHKNEDGIVKKLKRYYKL